MEHIYTTRMDEAIRQVLKWGDQVVYNPVPGAQPISKGLLIDIPPIGEFPHLFTLDLQIINNLTGLPPLNLWNAAFFVMFGAGNDSRQYFMPPGIHSIIGETLRVSIRLPAFLGAPPNWTYHAHCMIQDGVSPSYTFV